MADQTMRRDFYEVLGVGRDARARRRSSGRIASWPGPTIPTSTRTPRRKRRFAEVSEAYDVLPIRTPASAMTCSGTTSATCPKVSTHRRGHGPVRRSCRVSPKSYGRAAHRPAPGGVPISGDQGMDMGDLFR